MPFLLLLLIPLDLSEISAQKNLRTIIYLYYVIETISSTFGKKEGWSGNIPIVYNIVFMNKNPEKKDLIIWNT